MNECLKHRQRYPQQGYCVYCGRPDGLQAAGVPVSPMAPDSSGGVGFCMRCNQAWWGGHTCVSYTTVSSTNPLLAAWPRVTTKRADQ